MRNKINYFDTPLQKGKATKILLQKGQEKIRQVDECPVCFGNGKVTHNAGLDGEYTEDCWECNAPQEESDFSEA